MNDFMNVRLSKQSFRGDIKITRHVIVIANNKKEANGQSPSQLLSII